MPNQYNPKIHHRGSMRLKDYDYSTGGYYFVTICTKNKIECFGKITNGKMVLSEYGKIAEKQWLWLAEQYDYVKLDEWIIMPNHLHGILIIENNIIPVGTGRDPSLQQQARKIKPLSELIGAFKTTSSKLIHRHGLSDFQWQKSFYDYIIRDEKSLDNIREYIRNNPQRWNLDRNNPENLYM